MSRAQAKAALERPAGERSKLRVPNPKPRFAQRGPLSPVTEPERLRKRLSDERDTRGGPRSGVMIAAIGLGLLGTVLVVVLVIAGIMFFLRRA